MLNPMNLPFKSDLSQYQIEQQSFLVFNGVI